ncbi:MAG: hypothetical protein JSS66_01030 [Armatimonadetes bacterium]|nr:hypothetical protein [Armatimonadota bacterium]
MARKFVVWAGVAVISVVGLAACSLIFLRATVLKSTETLLDTVPNSSGTCRAYLVQNYAGGGNGSLDYEIRIGGKSTRWQAAEPIGRFSYVRTAGSTFPMILTWRRDFVLEISYDFAEVEGFKNTCYVNGTRTFVGTRAMVVLVPRDLEKSTHPWWE